MLYIPRCFPIFFRMIFPSSRFNWIQKYQLELQCLLVILLAFSWFQNSPILFGIALFLNVILIFHNNSRQKQIRLSNTNSSQIIEQQRLSKQNESSLEEENLLIKDILNEIREGVLVVDKNGIIQFYNTAAKVILSQENHFVGKHILDINLPHIIQKSYKKTLEGEELQIIWKQGSKPERRYYEISNLPSQRTGFISIIRDITKLKRLERMKRDFIANVSHEIRTPIAIIQANTETLLDGALRDEEFAVKFIRTIHRNTRRMGHLVEELLDLSKIESGEFQLELQQYYIYPIVDNILKDVEDEIQKKQHQIIIHIDMNAQGFFDQSAMKQIIANYIINAIKYTPPNSTITISTKRHNSDTILLSVQDNGIGIPAKYLPRVFERFFRVDKGRSREEGGTGLGLAIVKHLAQLMNCSVGAENNPDGGAHFWCRIPKGEFLSDTEELIQAMQNESPFL